MKLLLVDDEPCVHELIRSGLKKKFQFRSAFDFKQAVKALDQEEPHAAIIDLRLTGDGSGIDFLELFKRRFPEKPAIIQTGTGDPATVVQCMKLGATDFIQKPYDLPTLELRIERALAENRKQVVWKRLAEKENEPHRLVGDSETIRRIKSRIEVSGSMRILFSGESGVGKTPFARFSNACVAAESGEPRAFEQINCAGLNRELFQDQIFGHRKGAFTGAVFDKKGFVELAEGGDLFLDEIGEMPLEVQASFLTFLDTLEYYRLGDDQKRVATIRILSATNRNLKSMVQEGSFRKDLYSRIAQVTVEIPPLRERKEEIPQLVSYFVQKCCGYAKFLDPELLKWFLSKDWTEGNIRELRDKVELLCTVGRKRSSLTKDLLHEL